MMAAAKTIPLDISGSNALVVMDTGHQDGSPIIDIKNALDEGLVHVVIGRPYNPRKYMDELDAREKKQDKPDES